MLDFPTVGKIGGQISSTTSSANGLILREEKLRTLTVKKIHEQLDKHRSLCRPGMLEIPRNYRLKNKAAKLGALRIAVAEHLKNMSQGSDMDGDTLGADSRRQSAQMLNVELDELELEKTDVGMYSRGNNLKHAEDRL
jgi:hypothetical protein